MSLKNLNPKHGILISNLKEFSNLKLVIEQEKIPIDNNVLTQTEKSLKSTDHKFIYNPFFGFIFLPVFLMVGGIPLNLEIIETKVTDQDIKKEKNVITRKDLIMIHRETDNEELKEWIISEIYECGPSLDDEETEMTSEDIKEYDDYFTSPKDRGLLMKYNFGITLVKEEPKQEEKLPEILVILMSI